MFPLEEADRYPCPGLHVLSPVVLTQPPYHYYHCVGILNSYTRRETTKDPHPLNSTK